MTTRSSRAWRFASGALVAGVVAASSAARAEPTSESARAEALFREATKLLDAGKVAPACARFAESKRLEPGIGVTLFLGDCYERLGRTASAWGEFTAAEDLAHRAHDPRAKVAHDRATHLEPLPTLLVLLDRSAKYPIDVKEDGVDLGPSLRLGVPLPIDPGEHHLSATAPGRAPWERDIRISASGSMTVNVPALDLVEEPPVRADDPAPAPKEPSAPRANDDDTGHTRRVVALVTAGVGVAGLTLGAIFGLSAKGKLDDSNAGGCNARDQCDPAGLAMRSDGLGDATLSTIAFAAGGAALASGLVLYLTAPRAHAGAVEVGAGAAKGGGEVLVTARF